MSGCTIGDVTYADGDVNPENHCMGCSPAESTDAWTVREAGIVCDTGRICDGDECREGCWIDSSYYASGEANPTNPCQVCIPSTSVSTWSQVATSSCVTAMAGGNQHTCAVVNGAVACWGDNQTGQLGNNSTVDSYTPVRVQGLTSNTTAIAAGANHTCAIENGGVKCWGYNGYGQLGNNATATAVLTPTQVPGLTSRVAVIDAGNHHTCAIVSGSAKCWGYNSTGQLGINSYTNSVSTPTQVLGLTSGSAVIGAGDYHTCAVVNGDAYCWGVNSRGQLGNNSVVSPMVVPVKVTMP